MPWIASEDFDSYSTGANLNTLNGGNNWGAAWSNVSGTATVETAPSGGQGGKAARVQNPGSEVKYQRQISGTALQAGSVIARIRASTTNPSAGVDRDITLSDGSNNGRMYIRLASSGNIQINNGGSYETIGSYSADTWYTIEIDWNNFTQPNKFRARIDSGDWSAWKGVMTPGSYTTISHFLFVDADISTHDFWIDDIKGVPAVAAQSPRSFPKFFMRKPLQVGRLN